MQSKDCQIAQLQLKCSELQEENCKLNSQIYAKDELISKYSRIIEDNKKVIQYWKNEALNNSKVKYNQELFLGKS